MALCHMPNSHCTVNNFVPLDLLRCLKQQTHSFVQNTRLTLIQKQNSDVCTSCGGPGELVCCEGCWRAFHHSCWDPPHGKENLPEGDFYCYKCRNHRNLPPIATSPGALDGLFGDLNKTNPIAFTLSRPVRDYFEGVKTGEEGEYEEASTVKANK